ncbi:hypothetical protein N0V83_002744 [Neocucurbitaria cava]|uniref:Uncharacterized protein n=1 Tax=Neocucurbitaria cava TaxID=798079 RepID=A0A9W8YF14_9PLEO|nr:hypothetical protein N0V83_002744 [Neocucurbitaria cava]
MSVSIVSLPEKVRRDSAYNVVTLQNTDQEVKAQCQPAPDILRHLYELRNSMESLKTHIDAQILDNKPLCKWAKFEGYPALGHAISALVSDMKEFASLKLPKGIMEIYHKHATQVSLSVSHAAMFAMNKMAAKLEESDQPAEEPRNAMKYVAKELEMLLKHCTRATASVYLAVDALHERLVEANQDLDITNFKKLVLKSAAKERAPYNNCMWVRVAIILGAVVGILTGLAAVHLFGRAGFDMALRSNDLNNDMYAQVLRLVQRTRAVTNGTKDVYTALIQDIEAVGQCLDNIVDSLGPTNQNGRYYYA